MIRANLDANRGKRDGQILQPVDLLLSGVSSAAAVYAAGASLASDKNATFFMWVVIVGTLCSGMFVWFGAKTKFLMADTTAYTLISIISVFGISSLNSAVPESIYTGPLQMAGVLSWMLALGSFTIWRDQTMLFQAVPAVALFGLVGCYDTFRASVVYFFVFLICQATLMARAHGRAMLRQARSSGVEALEMSAMRKGPWRWMAGPEWALASALTIVLLSIIGAPLLRESAKGFSGLVRYTPPASPLTNRNVAGFNAAGTRIGTGPNLLSENPVLRAELPEAMYLRGFAYGRYDEGMWHPRTQTTGVDGFGSSDAPLLNMTDRREFTFKIEPLIVISSIVPVPGEVEAILGNPGNAYVPNMGGSYNVRAEAPFPPLEGRAFVFGGRTPIKDADPIVGQVVPEYVQVDGIPTDVLDFAKEVTKDAKTDYEKAQAIKRAIENQVKYNLNASATPSGTDPVSYFLFTTKEGYCDLFASSMTLMARAVGLPARYVTGYYPFNSSVDDRGRLIVRQKDAHAWSEVFFKDAGWVVFDATEGAVSVDGGGVGSANNQPFWQAGWFVGLIVVCVGSAIGYGLYVAVGGYVRFRRSADFEGIATQRALLKLQGQVRKQYVSFERELSGAVRRPRRMGETILEYVSAAEPNLGHRAGIAQETGGAFAAALYAPFGLESATIEDLKGRVKTFRQSRRSKPA